MGAVRKDVPLSEVPVSRLIRALEGTPVFDEATREVLVEKFDTGRISAVFDAVSEGSCSVIVVRTGRPSPLARLILETKTRFEVISDVADEAEVLSLLEDRLLGKQFRLVCTNCGWSSLRTLRTLEAHVQCPACGSSMIAPQPPDHPRVEQVLRRQRSGVRLTRTEQRELKSASLAASLVAQYGKRALLVLAGHGIGPHTAAQILKPHMTDRTELLRAIARAEAEYARTRPFWS